MRILTSAQEGGKLECGEEGEAADFSSFLVPKKILRAISEKTIDPISDLFLPSHFPEYVHAEKIYFAFFEMKLREVTFLGEGGTHERRRLRPSDPLRSVTWRALVKTSPPPPIPELEQPLLLPFARGVKPGLALVGAERCISLISTAGVFIPPTLRRTYDLTHL